GSCVWGRTHAARLPRGGLGLHSTCAEAPAGGRAGWRCRLSCRTHPSLLTACEPPGLRPRGEGTLVAAALDSCFTAPLPQRFIGVRVLHADLLDEALAVLGVRINAPHGAIASTRRPRIAAPPSTAATSGVEKRQSGGGVTSADWWFATSATR